MACIEVPSASGLILFNELLTRVVLVTKTPAWCCDNWELPKGGLQRPGWGSKVPETLEELAFREVEEETGILEDEVQVSWDCTADLETRFGPVRWWGAQVLGFVLPEPRPGDQMKAAKWWPVKAALSHVLRKDQRIVLEYVWNGMRRRRDVASGVSDDVLELEEFVEEFAEATEIEKTTEETAKKAAEVALVALEVTRPLLPRPPLHPPPPRLPKLKWLSGGAERSVPAQSSGSRSRSRSPRLCALTSPVNNRGEKICEYYNCGTCIAELEMCACIYGLHVCNWVLSDGTVCSRDHACIDDHATGLASLTG
jgi:8-oxo-dGTP pyrophosphatase MutT (NUDIX family)